MLIKEEQKNIYSNLSHKKQVLQNADRVLNNEFSLKLSSCIFRESQGLKMISNSKPKGFFKEGGPVIDTIRHRISTAVTLLIRIYVCKMACSPRKDVEAAK